METIDKKKLVEQGLRQFAQDASFQQLFEWILDERDKQWIHHIDFIKRDICTHTAFT